MYTLLTSTGDFFEFKQNAGTRYIVLSALCLVHSNYRKLD